MNLGFYKFNIKPLSVADGGGYVAVAPELPGCISDGETAQEALANAYDAIVCWTEGAFEMGRPMPEPRGAMRS